VSVSRPDAPADRDDTPAEEGDPVAKTRRRRLLLMSLTVLLIAGGTATRMDAAQAESNGGVRVMPLGDSITDGTQVPGGYRIGLWQRLTAAGYRDDFVGSQFNGPASLGDHDHEGHPGWRIDQIDASINGWLTATTPHSILLHIGTNDVLQNDNLAGAPGRLSSLIDHITAAAPAAEVFVASIVPLSSASQEAAGRTFNAAIPGIVQSKVNAGKRVHFVDMHAALTAADLIDGIHPTATGYDKMAATWYTALRAVPGSIGNPGGPSQSPSQSPSQAPSPSPTPTSAPPGGGPSCTAAYAVTGQWQGGFQAAVTVTAGAASISSWTVTWQFGAGQAVTQVWSAVITVSGADTIAGNVGYNGALIKGAGTQFGFLGSSQGTPTVPAVRCAAS
jgi:lysophospholipase L1-like esterase